MSESRPPLGRQLGITTKAVSRTFSAYLTDAGGSLPTWLILRALKQRDWRTQQDLAAEVGIEGPTLTRHLDGLEAAGLIARARDPKDRRAIRVETTEAGDALFQQLRGAAKAFDRRLREGLSAGEEAELRRLLDLLVENVADARPPARDRAGV